MMTTILALVSAVLVVSLAPDLSVRIAEERQLAQRGFDMTDRYANQFVNDVFRDNMLLTLNFLRNGKTISNPIDWEAVNQPFHYELKLAPETVFAFHDALAPQYKDRAVVTTNAHFNASEGFKSDGWLVGDGVCQLASLINWVARDAGLLVEAKVNHDFARIPGVPREFGVSIYSLATDPAGSQVQNLYVTNNREKPVKFVFHYDGTRLNITAKELL